MRNPAVLHLADRVLYRLVPVVVITGLVVISEVAETPGHGLGDVPRR
jgi:thiosulfate reductase cytochrome b subunit